MGYEKDAPSLPLGPAEPDAEAEALAEPDAADVGTDEPLEMAEDGKDEAEALPLGRADDATPEDAALDGKAGAEPLAGTEVGKEDPEALPEGKPHLG